MSRQFLSDVLIQVADTLIDVSKKNRVDTLKMDGVYNHQGECSNTSLKFTMTIERGKISQIKVMSK